MLRQMLQVFAVWVALATCGWASDVGNRLTYLDSPIDPYYVNLAFPRLITPQWVGEEGVEAVVVLAIDDLSSERMELYETFLRPILARLQQSGEGAGMSAMTNLVDPHAPQLTRWLSAGMSIETHTASHPCPLLQGAQLQQAKATFDKSVDQIASIPDYHPVAFRMPCCDSMSSVSPRFFAEIFNRTTPEGRFLRLDSSVFQVFTAADPDLPRECVVDEEGRKRFAKYVPADKQMVNLVENYPYPYVIGRMCWEFPSLMPSDWDAYHYVIGRLGRDYPLLTPDDWDALRLQGMCNPETVRDMQRAIDAAVAKQGVFSLCFHPHGWIQNTQIIQLIDHAERQHGGKVKFLSFRAVVQRLTQNLLGGHPLRNAAGGDNGVRLLDVDNDGFLDVVVGNDQARITRRWDPASRQWQETAFPVQLVTGDSQGQAVETGVRFGVLRPDGQASVLVRAEQQGVWHFADGHWTPADTLVPPGPTSVAGRDLGVRLRDLDLDGICELIVAAPDQSAVYRLADAGWERLPWTLPSGLALVDSEGQDRGLRFVDLEGDGHSDLVFSGPDRSAVYAFASLQDGWARRLLDVPRTDAAALPMIVRADGSNNGVWFRHCDMWLQNEDTGGATPFHVDHRRLLGQPPAPEPEPTPAASR